jgi:hypothetical protein
VLRCWSTRSSRKPRADNRTFWPWAPAQMAFRKGCPPHPRQPAPAERQSP